MYSLGLVEIGGWSVALVVLDALDKAARIHLLQVELNDYYGVCMKMVGPTAEVQTAIGRARQIAGSMQVRCVAEVIAAPDPRSRPGYQAPAEYNVLIEQDVVHIPASPEETSAMSEEGTFAIGMIETQGFTAVIEAIDTACKAADVEVIGREKLGGGYITILIKGDVAAVTTAIEAGRQKVDGLGNLIAAHVIARPSASILRLLPRQD